MVLARLSSWPLALLLAATAHSPLHAQAPRETAELDLGTAQITVEYGSPPWTEERRALIERGLPVGSVWRLGADTRTTLVVTGEPVRIGDAVIEAGGYGLNLRRTGEKEWAFVVFDGTDSSVQLEDPEWEVPARFEERAADAAADRLVVAFEEAGERRSLVVRWGPFHIEAPVGTVITTESALELAGEQASARWYARKVGEAPRPGAWIRAGTIGSFYAGDVDCAMDVDLRIDGNQARVRFTNRERGRVASRLARIEREIDRARSGAGGQGPAARFQARVKRLEDMKTAITEELAALATHPAPVEVEVSLQPAKKPAGRISAELVRRDGRLVVAVDTFDRSGETAIEESKLLPAPAEDGQD